MTTHVSEEQLRGASILDMSDRIETSFCGMAWLYDKETSRRLTEISVDKTAPGLRYERIYTVRQSSFTELPINLVHTRRPSGTWCHTLHLNKAERGRSGPDISVFHSSGDGIEEQEKICESFDAY